jgi:hypothetical protein
VRGRKLLPLIAVGGLLFLSVSALLARVFSADNSEQTAITALIQAEARGDASAMASRLRGCPRSPDCRARVDQVSSSLRRAGRVSILQLRPSTGFSLTGTAGSARVAWNTATSPQPIVQCVRVRRGGDVLSGLTIQLLEISPRIRSDADCPSRF